jgi:ribosomal protein L11 methyltransferase
MSAKRTRPWYALDVETEASAREAVEYALMEAGALGTETDDVRQTSVCRSASTPNDKVNFVGQLMLRVTGYFEHPPNRESVRTELADALHTYSLASSSVREMNVREVPDEDWLGEWKKSWQPVEVGERFIIAPPWSDVSDERSRIVIRIEPGMAFGTGTHETTRLCLAAIEKYFEGGSFLDIGTGTGILAIAAAKLARSPRGQPARGVGPFPDARIEACDTDAEAIAIARENAHLNGVSEKIIFRVGTVEDSMASAEVVCANLTADVINSTLPSLLSVTCGRLILSGILDSQLDVVRARLRENGVSDPLEIMQDGEWIALII